MAPNETLNHAKERASGCVHFTHECFRLSRPNVEGSHAVAGLLGRSRCRQGLKGGWLHNAPLSSANKSVDFSFRKRIFDLPVCEVNLNNHIYIDASLKLTYLHIVLVIGAFLKNRSAFFKKNIGKYCKLWKRTEKK